MNPRLAILLFLTAALTSCGRNGHHAEHEPLPGLTVSVQPAEEAIIPVYEDVVGTVHPRQHAEVAAKISGRILNIDATPGRKVAKGEVIAELEVGEIRAALDRAEAALERAEQDLKRYRELLASNAVTQAEFDQIQAQHRMAAASVRESKAMLDNAKVTAPFDGVITRELADEGDLAQPGKPLFQIENPSEFRLEINVAESLANTLEIGQEHRVDIAAADLMNLKASVVEIAPSADPGSRTFLVKLDLPKREGLRAGQFGRARLPRTETTAVLAPAEALLRRGQMELVFVANEDHAELRIVRTGREIDGQIELLSGVEPGEKLIVSPPAELQDGQPLSIEKS